jgi:hypothetical protein
MVLAKNLDLIFLKKPGHFLLSNIISYEIICPIDLEKLLYKPHFNLSKNFPCSTLPIFLSYKIILLKIAFQLSFKISFGPPYQFLPHKTISSTKLQKIQN